MNVNMSLKEILNIGENQYFDRKSSKIQVNKLAETMIAFANADGGTIAIGIDEVHVLF